MSFWTRSHTTPWRLRPPTTFANRNTTLSMPYVCAKLAARASHVSLLAPYIETGISGP